MGVVVELDRGQERTLVLASPSLAGTDAPEDSIVGHDDPAEAAFIRAGCHVRRRRRCAGERATGSAPAGNAPSEPAAEEGSQSLQKLLAEV